MSRISINLSTLKRSSTDKPIIHQPFGPSPQTSLRKKSSRSKVIGKSLSLPEKLSLLDSVRKGEISSSEILSEEIEIGTPLGSTFGSPSESPMNSFLFAGPVTARQGILVSIDEVNKDLDESIRGSVNEVIGSVDNTVQETQDDHEEPSHPTSNDKERSLNGRALALSRVAENLDQIDNNSSNSSSNNKYIRRRMSLAEQLVDELKTEVS